MYFIGVDKQINTHSHISEKNKGYRKQQQAWHQVLRDLPYEERLQKLDLPTLEQRKERGDFIAVYRMMNGLEVDGENSDMHSKRFKMIWRRVKGSMKQMSRKTAPAEMYRDLEWSEGGCGSG